MINNILTYCNKRNQSDGKSQTPKYENDKVWFGTGTKWYLSAI